VFHHSIKHTSLIIKGISIQQVSIPSTRSVQTHPVQQIIPRLSNTVINYPRLPKTTQTVQGSLEQSQDSLGDKFGHSWTVSDWFGQSWTSLLNWSVLVCPWLLKTVQDSKTVKNNTRFYKTV